MRISRALSSSAHRPVGMSGGWRTKRHRTTWSRGQWNGSQVTAYHAIPAERVRHAPCQFRACVQWRRRAARPGPFSGIMEGGSSCHFDAAQHIGRGNKPEASARERSSAAAVNQMWAARTRARTRSGGLEGVRRRECAHRGRNVVRSAGRQRGRRHSAGRKRPHSAGFVEGSVFPSNGWVHL